MAFPTRFSYAPAARKEPIDSEIEKRRKRAGDPPKDEMPNPEKGGPASSPNPDSMNDHGSKPKLNQMQWYMGSYALELELDHEGRAKWPLSFKRIEKDTKRPNKGGDGPVKHKGSPIEQPPTAA